MLPFGELVLARRPGAHLQKSQTQFKHGCWLGSSHTDEHIVGSKAGIFRARTVRRLTEDRSWSAEAADMEWTPWKTAEPIWNAPLPAMPNDYLEPPPRSADSKARSETVREVTSTSGKSDVQERPPLEPDDEMAEKTPRRDVEDTSMPDSGGTLIFQCPGILDTTRHM